MPEDAPAPMKGNPASPALPGPGPDCACHLQDILPPSDQEMRRVMAKYDMYFLAPLRKPIDQKDKRPAPLVSKGELLSYVGLRVDKAYRTKADFRAKVRAGGMAAFAKHEWLPKWIKWGTTEQLFKHYKSKLPLLPRTATHAEEDLMRLAKGKPEGCLFPLVGPQSEDEHKILARLLRADKVKEREARPGEGVWPVVGSQETTLELTQDANRCGDALVEDLVERGFFRLERCDPDSPSRWRFEENLPVTVILTDMGRWYLEATDHVSFAVSMDQQVYDAEDDGPGFQLAEERDDIEDSMDAVRRAEWVRDVPDILRMLIAEPGIPPRSTKRMQKILGLFYLRIGQWPDFQGLTLQETSRLTGTPVPTLSTWNRESGETEFIAMLRDIPGIGIPD